MRARATGPPTVSRQVLQLGARLGAGEPKSDSGERTVALDAGTVDVLRLHRVRQLEERLQWGAAWTDTGLVSPPRTAPRSGPPTSPACPSA